MQIDIKTIKSRREQQQVMKLQSDAAWYEMKAALIRFYLAVRYYNPEQPRVPAGNGRESGRWGDGSGASTGRVSDGRVRYAQARTPRRFMSDAIERFRINGREEELDQAESLDREVTLAARNWAVGEAQKIDPNYTPPAGVYSSFNGYMAQMAAERDDAELFVVNANREANGLPPLTMEQLTSSYSPSIRNTPTETILAPNGQLVGWHTTSSRFFVRTVDRTTFDDLVTRLTYGQTPSSWIPRYEGVWYERGDSCVIGLRVSSDYGPTIDLIRGNGSSEPILPSNFKVHSK